MTRVKLAKLWLKDGQIVDIKCKQCFTKDELKSVARDFGKLVMDYEDQDPDKYLSDMEAEWKKKAGIGGEASG